METPATDDPIFTALAGRDEANTAIKDHDPDVAAELYTTNGDIDRRRLRGVRRRSRYTVELSGGFGGPVGGTDGTAGAYTPDGFAFQDSDADIETEFQDNLQFALDLARSAQDPDDPVSHIGNRARGFVPTTFDRSYGDPQLVEVNAKRTLGARSAPTGRSSGPTAAAAAACASGRAACATASRASTTTACAPASRTGAQPGQHVRVWFTGRGGRSAPRRSSTRSSPTPAPAR